MAVYAEYSPHWDDYSPMRSRQMISGTVIWTHLPIYSTGSVVSTLDHSPLSPNRKSSTQQPANQ